jgi:hypothetical protein
MSDALRTVPGVRPRARGALWATAASGLVLCAALGQASGCASDPARGYVAASAFPADISSVAVPIFENETFHREVEFELADALVKEIERRTPYKVTAAARADSILVGTIRSVELRPLSRSRQTGLGEEVLLSVTVDFRWSDRRTDAVLAERRSFTAQGLFVPSRPSREPIEVGSFSAAEQLARDIVDAMQSRW